VNTGVAFKGVRDKSSACFIERISSSGAATVNWIERSQIRPAPVSLSE